MSGNWHKRGNIRGADGVGVPEGGQPGQMLQKVGSSDHATGWAFPEYKDILGKVPKSALPDIGNSTQVVNSESAMLNLPAVTGNMVIRTDLGKTFVLAEEPASVLENWVELVTSSDVQSVNGKTGNVTLTKADVGLSKVNNTADADKPVATTSVNGLMSKTDKAALNGATYQATANALVKRTSTGTASFSQLALTDAPTSSGHATTKDYVDAQVSSVAGGSVLSDTDWNAMRTTTSTGVVEGWVKGCPAGGKIVGTMSAGFVMNPVWRLEVRPEGLNYVTQRATLLNCTPKYMVGFAWERVYNPVTSKWTGWTCVAGDTGPLRSVEALSGSEAGPEAPLRHLNTSATKPWGEEAIQTQRAGGNVYIWGEMQSTSSSLSGSTKGVPFASLLTIDDVSGNPTHPGVDYILCPNVADELQLGWQRGNTNDQWILLIAERRTLNAARHSNYTGSSRWLPFSASYSAPPINTYTGPGFVPPILNAQSGIRPS